MKLLLRWLSLRYRLQARHWKRRALEAERQLDAEVWRNRSREDELMTVPMRMLGMWGMPTRAEPAAVRQNPRLIRQPDIVQHADPWQGLTFLEKAEFEQSWLPDALANNVSETAAREDFLREILKRKQQISDGPMM